MEEGWFERNEAHYKQQLKAESERLDAVVAMIGQLEDRMATLEKELRVSRAFMDLMLDDADASRDDAEPWRMVVN